MFLKGVGGFAGDSFTGLYVWCEYNLVLNAAETLLDTDTGGGGHFFP